MSSLEEFLREGGLLIAMGNGGVLAVEGGLVRRVNLVPRGSFHTPGSEFRAKVLRTGHPLSYGYEERTSVFRGNYALFDVAKRDRGRVVLQFGTKEVPEPGESEEKQETSAEESRDESLSGTEVEPTAMSGSHEAPGSEAGKKAEDLVLSGHVKEKDLIDGKPAVLDLPVGEGRAILFAFNPFHRYLNHSDFRWVYNAILNWNDMPRP